MDGGRIAGIMRGIVSRRAGPGAALVSLATRPLDGGISADQVVAVRAAYVDAAGRRRSLELVVKRLSGAARREAAVYRDLQRLGVSFAPRVLAVDHDDRATSLFLERVTSVERWPWRDTAQGEAVLRTAAALHAGGDASAPAWDYDADLCASAAATLDGLAAARRSGEVPIDAASLRAVRRVVGALGGIRREVVFSGPFARSLIHGDLHPGNVFMASRAGATSPVLLDWGRARVGSPLEDVASWVQSLGCWEPAARLRHDTLLGAYLRARGGGAPISAPIRQAYWLAGASNALAGAVLHHVGVATASSATPAARTSAVWALRDWLRIIRRAEATWLHPERARGGSARRT
jgi:hypothetical protein